MKARYFANQADVKKASLDILSKEADKLYADVVETLLPQITAVECYILHTKYRFGKKRIMDFLNSKNELYDFISDNDDVLGKKLSMKDIVNSMEDYLNVKFNIEKFVIQDSPVSKKRRLK